MIRPLKSLLLIGAAAACSLAGAALAADPQDGDKAAMLEKAFGSTIVSTYPDGRQGELWLQRDGVYTGSGRRQDRSSGRWLVKDDKLCLKQQKPFPAPFSYCTPLPTGGLEKPWSARAWSGEAITIKLVKGLHGRDAGPRKAGEDDKDDKNDRG
jgi:hypothetical protein